MKHKKLSVLFVLFLVFLMSSTIFAASGTTTSLPTIYGKAAITVDVATGEVIYAKNVDNKMYPASITNIMTVLLFAQNKKKTDQIKYTQSAKAQPEYSLNVNLHPIGLDETMSGSDVMDGLLLYSGNDVAYMIADSVGGNAAGFIKKMNDKAAKLGMTGTHFVTANGLQDPNHYTTPYDMSILAKTAFSNQWVKESMGKKKSTIATSKGTTFMIENRNKILGVDGCIAGKTGYTSQAGECLVSLFQRDGRQIISVVMGSVYDANNTAVYNDTKKIINYSYSLKPTLLHASGSVLKTETLKYKPLLFFGPEKTVNVPIVVKEDISYYNNEANKKNLKEKVNLTKISASSLKADKSVGTLTLNEKGKIKSYKLYSTISKGTLAKDNMLLYLVIALVSILVLTGIILLIRKIRFRKRRRGRRYY